MAKSRKGLLATSILCILLAVAAYFVAREQDRIRSKYGEAPHSLSVAQLGDHGYDNNVWVDLTDVELLPHYVVQERNGSITAAWAAAVPKGTAQKAQEIKVVVRTSKSKTDAEINEHFQPRATYRGAVINPLLLAPYDPYRGLLQEALPKHKLAPTIWEVDIDYTKPSEKWAKNFRLATAVLSFIGFACGAAWLLFLLWPSDSDTDEHSQSFHADFQTSLRA